MKQNYWLIFKQISGSCTLILQGHTDDIEHATDIGGIPMYVIKGYYVS